MDTVILYGSGVIQCPTGQGITVKSVQVDVQDPGTNDINLVLTGAVSNTTYTMTAIVPVVGDMNFFKDEDVNVGVTGNFKSVIINYTTRGSTSVYMQEDPNRAVNKKLIPGKWNIQ